MLASKADTASQLKMAGLIPLSAPVSSALMDSLTPVPAFTFSALAEPGPVPVPTFSVLTKGLPSVLNLLPLMLTYTDPHTHPQPNPLRHDVTASYLGLPYCLRHTDRLSVSYLDHASSPQILAV